jgi:hypothetical protein
MQGQRRMRTRGSDSACEGRRGAAIAGAPALARMAFTPVVGAVIGGGSSKPGAIWGKSLRWKLMMQGHGKLTVHDSEIAGGGGGCVTLREVGVGFG